jgi:hypothetical protein
MRHGSHGCACFRPFADYRKREETKQPRGGWPTSSKRLSRRPSMRGSSALPWTTPGCGAVEARAGQAEAALHAAQAGLALRAAALDDAQAEPMRGSGPPTSDHLADAGTRPPTNATARPTSRCSRRPGDRTTAPGPRLRLGLPRDLCRAASCWPCDRVVWAASLPCIGPLTHGRRPRRQHLLLLHVVACYKRSSGVLAAGRAGDERVSGPRYRGLRIG